MSLLIDLIGQLNLKAYFRKGLFSKELTGENFAFQNGLETRAAGIGTDRAPGSLNPTSPFKVHLVQKRKKCPRLF